jgi:hypothetical protein
MRMLDEHFARGGQFITANSSRSPMSSSDYLPTGGC